MFILKYDPSAPGELQDVTGYSLFFYFFLNNNKEN